MWLEAAVVTCVFAVIMVVGTRIPVRLPRRWESGFDAVARRRRLAVLLVFLVAISMRLVVLRWVPVPEPSVHDEFSHLLLADTFASGRITNPPHPMWKHFETLHVIHHPSYTSMYPVGQGLVLALGQVLTGHPWTGVLFSVGAMCASICWMLQAWLPPRWALLAGLLAAVRFGIFSYWVNSYFGGAVAAIAGALVLGAFGRVQRFPRASNALLLGLGVALLANTRPYEGLVFSLPVAFAIVMWLVRRFREPMVWQVVVPLGLILALTLLGMGYYFWRVTGSPIRMPYQVNRQTYAVTPYFLFQHPNPQPDYRHTVMQKFYVRIEMQDYLEERSIPGWLRHQWSIFRQLLSFYFGPALALPLITLPWMWRDRRVRFLVLVGASLYLGTLSQTWTFMHYVAPGTGVVYAVIAQGMRHLRCWGNRRRAMGLLLAWSVPLVCVIMLAVRIQQQRLGIPPRLASPFFRNWQNGVHERTARARIQQELERRPSQDLVIVHYRPDHNPHNEWVYNAADIDHAGVVWAREMDPASTSELVRYFKNRQVWLVEADLKYPELLPYPRGNVADR
jgi:hypothetical protein